MGGEAKYGVGDLVNSARELRPCRVESVKAGGPGGGWVYSLVSSDGKRSFDAREDDLLPVKPGRQPRQ